MADNRKRPKLIKKCIYVILSLVLLSCQNEQEITYPEYYRNFNKINEYLNSGQLGIAITKFDSLSARIPHVPSSHLFKVARLCSENNLCDLSAKYLKKSIENGKEYGKGIGQYKTIDQCSKEIESVLKMESEIHIRNLNFYYKAQIDSMFQADQKARNESDYETMKVVDSLNMLTLLHQIEKYGYPGEKLI